MSDDRDVTRVVAAAVGRVGDDIDRVAGERNQQLDRVLKMLRYFLFLTAI